MYRPSGRVLSDDVLSDDVLSDEGASTFRSCPCGRRLFSDDLYNNYKPEHVRQAEPTTMSFDDFHSISMYISRVYFGMALDDFSMCADCSRLRHSGQSPIKIKSASRATRLPTQQKKTRQNLLLLASFSLTPAASLFEPWACPV